MFYLKTFALFALTALAEIIGCYGFWLVWRKGVSNWLMLPSALILMLFAWLLCLHPMGAGRTFAAYGGVYVATALLWGIGMEGLRPNFSDWAGAALCLCGAAVIVLGAKG